MSENTAAFDAWMLQRFGEELSGVSPLAHGQFLEAWDAATSAERSRCVQIAKDEAESQDSYGGSDAVGACSAIASAIRNVGKQEQS